MTAGYAINLLHPWWLLAAAGAAPLLVWSWRALRHLGPTRRVLAVCLRLLTIVILALVLAQPTLVETSKTLTVIAVMDRSESVPPALQEASRDYLVEALGDLPAPHRLAVIDVAEAADIAQLPSREVRLGERNASLTGAESNLAAGIEMALAIAPPDSAARIIFVSDGNQNAGDLLAAARSAGANAIPVDVLPLLYRYENEVVARRLAAPVQARRGQTIELRMILESTHAAHGEVLFTVNGMTLDLNPGAETVGLPVTLREGPNVVTVPLPLQNTGLHQFEAVFVPGDESMDRITANNHAAALTLVQGPGHVLLVDQDGRAAGPISAALEHKQIEVRYQPAAALPDDLSQLLNTDLVVLADTPNHLFSHRQQQMLVRYVTELGGGLLMTGGPDAFGAGGWIGSPVAEILPVDLDPPQKRQMPQGALVLVIDRSGSMMGPKLEICKVAAAAAVRLLSRQDLVGVVVFDDVSKWLVPLALADDKEAISRRIGELRPGGGTIMAPAMRMAQEALQDVAASIKHVILLTDGVAADREECAQMIGALAAADVTVSTVGVGMDLDTQLLHHIAQRTGGRFYPVTDPMRIPEIFVKEAQVVRRALIVEQTFAPQIAYGLSEAIRGFAAFPSLDGYVLTGPKGGLNQVVLVGPEETPLLATCQAGTGRCAVFTSTADSRWAGSWLPWAEHARFWEQLVRWTGRPAQSSDFQVYADVDGRRVTVTVERYDNSAAEPLSGQLIAPDLQTTPIALSQMGPGQYRAQFAAPASGNYVLQVYGEGQGRRQSSLSVVNVPSAPELQQLTDNAALLHQAADAAGGRVLPGDAAAANLFETTGLHFPQTHHPQTMPLLLLWLGVFLLDVAVRRVAWDVRAWARRAAALVRRRSDQRDGTATTLDRLRSTRQGVRAQLQRHARQRYTPKADGDADLPLTPAKAPPPERPRPTEPAPEAATAGAAADQQLPAHLQHLLRARRRVRDETEKTAATPPAAPKSTQEKRL